MDRAKQMNEYDIDKQKYQQIVISSLSKKNGFSDLRTGKKVIRDNNNNRINEKDIEYSWIVSVARSFIGWCWIFSIKLKKNKFRNINNSEELIQGIFTLNKNGTIDKFYSENRPEEFKDNIKNYTEYDMFEANLGIALDGVSYEYLIFAPNTEIKISLSSPNSKKWKKWEKELWSVGEYLVEKSKIEELKNIFE